MISPAEMSQKAKELAEDTTVLHILATLEARYINDWRNTQPTENQKREAAFAGMRALEDFRARLGSIANAPKVEAHNNRNVGRR